jgi:hypothetical protein
VRASSRHLDYHERDRTTPASARGRDRLIDRVDGLPGREARRRRREAADVMESYTYLDRIGGERPDTRRAEPILRLPLR